MPEFPEPWWPITDWNHQTATMGGPLQAVVVLPTMTVIIERVSEMSFRHKYCAYTNAAGIKALIRPPQFLGVADDDLELRCLLLRLAYPGGKP